MTQESVERPDEDAQDVEQLSDDGVALGLGDKNTFEPEEEPDAEAGQDSDEAAEAAGPN